MPVLRKTGASYSAPKAIFRNVGGSSHVPLKGVWRNVGGTWKQIWTSRTVSIWVSGSTQVRAGRSRYYDRITFSVQVSDGASVSSYVWGNDVYGTASTATFDGPIYDTNGWTHQNWGSAYVAVVIAGQTYTAELPFTYTSGDLN